MKKAVIIILAILPIFLAISISFAARILSIYEYIDVEGVAFVDEDNQEYTKDFVLKIEVGEQKQTKIKVSPILATNKNVSYTSDKEAVCTVNSEGVIEGKSLGSATISVKTEDGSKISMLHVSVTQERVTGVSLPYEEVELNVGDSIPLTAVVEPYTALNKKVLYYSSNTDIAVVGLYDGIVAAKAEGEVIISAVTDYETPDGEKFTDTCKVICKPEPPAISFDVSDFTPNEKGDVYVVKTNEINLLDYLLVNEEKVKEEDVKFKIQSGHNYATLDGAKLTITSTSKIITIVAYVEANPTYQAEIKLVYR